MRLIKTTRDIYIFETSRNGTTIWVSKQMLENAQNPKDQIGVAFNWKTFVRVELGDRWGKEITEIIPSTIQGVL